MAGKVYRTQPGSEDDHDDGRQPGEVHVAPGLMNEVKLARSIEKKRRERDKLQESLAQERVRLKRSGILAKSAVINVLLKKLAAAETELEDEIDRMVQLRGKEA